MDDQADTPSLYSHSVFSPDSSHYRSPISNSGISTLNDLAVSMLDMDEDQRSSFHSAMYDSVNSSMDNEDDYGGHDEEEDPRMSYLGPKMRYHSKAPWEVDSALEEEDEDDETTAENHSILSSSTTRRKPGIARHFPFGGARSERSSEDSGSSRNHVKLSLDSTSSHSSYSHSHDAYANNTSASQANSVHGGKQTFGFGRSRPRSPSPSHLSPTSPRSPVPYFSDRASSPMDHGPSTRSSGSSEMGSKPSFSYHTDESHPYANPDFAFSSSSDESNPHHPHKRYIPSSLSRSDLSTIGPESSSYPPPPSLLSGGIPSSPRLQSFKNQGKEISAPMPISVHSSPWKPTDVSSGNDTALPPSSLPGWTERAPSPAFNLISLEEARAQRSRSKTAHHVPTSTASVMSSNSSSIYPFPDDSIGGQSSSSGTPAHRTRARSVSAGARAKQALNNIVGSTATKIERRDSEHSLTGIGAIAQPGGKVLRNKRSGFLRLFNGTKDEKSPPPPVPSLSEGYAAFNAQQATTPKNTKLNSHRIPVPQISPTILDNSSGGSEEDYASAKSIHSPKRTPPPPLSLLSSNYVSGSLRPQPRSDIAQSAPANVTQFPALRLRPVSTVFSSQFGEHILPLSPEPETPSSVASPSAAVSPITPGPYNRPDNFALSGGDREKTKSSISTSSEPEDQSVAIRRLQEQISRAQIVHQQQIWELEGQVRDLKAELETVRNKSAADKDAPYCDRCGRRDQTDGPNHLTSVVNRPRARTGTGQSRFGSAV
ncbi:hypothetical protein PQX77_008208 [Marasmius sp. AFHP31]|nr:hypothetical protein PQX77_008267 [Marasmius sp. AFHP31]KAK1228714.1 hypothetical protein PQX77_008208 [Marasmius sp. AFHP31]